MITIFVYLSAYVLSKELKKRNPLQEISMPKIQLQENSKGKMLVYERSEEERRRKEDWKSEIGSS